MKCRGCRKNKQRKSFVNVKNKSGYSTYCISCRKLKGGALSDDIFQFFGNLVNKMRGVKGPELNNLRNFKDTISTRMNYKYEPYDDWYNELYKR